MKKITTWKKFSIVPICFCVVMQLYGCGQRGPLRLSVANATDFVKWFNLSIHAVHKTSK